MSAITYTHLDGLAGPTEDENQGKRPNPANLSRQQDDANDHLQNVSPCFVEHFWHPIEPFGISAYEGNRGAAVMCYTRQVDGLVMDDAYERTLRQQSELVESMLVCCCRNLCSSRLENQEGQ